VEVVLELLEPLQATTATIQCFQPLLQLAVALVVDQIHIRLDKQVVQVAVVESSQVFTELAALELQTKAMQVVRVADRLIVQVAAAVQVQWVVLQTLMVEMVFKQVLVELLLIMVAVVVVVVPLVVLVD
jgi:hypothetical protein